ncbi:MAG: Beta-glucosidase A [Turneriella sp.]|nr:Beta-glucosidase A [Turneriella sp.]
MEIKEPFLWGAATSAYQIEGARFAGGKTDSIWDTFAHRRRKIKNGENADITCEHYRRYAEDIRLMQKLNLMAYRFSISWPRIFPTKKGGINAKGLDHYDRLVDALLNAGIRPFVTLYHWDLPQYLEDKGGWTQRDTIQYFCEYANACANRLGDRVKNFIVFNEPMIFLTLGYLLGIHAPGRYGFKNFFRASHNVLLAQGEAARLLKAKLPNAEIGTTISATAAYPATENIKDINAAKRFDLLYNTFYLEAALYGKYTTDNFPFLKKIEKYIIEEDMDKMQFDFDFWGINTYTRKIVYASKIVPYAKWREKKTPKENQKTILGWEVYPEGIYDLLKKYATYDKIKKIYITENGAAFEDQLVAGRVVDTQRIEYLRAYTAQVIKARNEGAPIYGYFVWSLLDNFEWAEGFKPRFGLVYVDYPSGRRYIKDSGYWYRDFIQKNKIAPDFI